MEKIQQLTRTGEITEGQDKSGLGNLYKKAITERSRLRGFLSSFQIPVFLYLNQAKTYLEKSPSVSRLPTALKYFLVRKLVYFVSGDLKLIIAFI